MSRIIPEPYLSYSRKLRKSHNPFETRLWSRLRAGRLGGLKFKRQVRIGIYIFDFSCREKKVLIELDGGQHSKMTVSEHDRRKQGFAEEQGYRVLRIWNNQLLENFDGVLEIIKGACGV